MAVFFFPSRTKVTRSLGAFEPKRSQFSCELELKGENESLFDVDPSRSVANLDDIDGNFLSRNGNDSGEGRGDGAAALSRLNFLDPKDGGEGKKKSLNSRRSSEGERDLVPIEDGDLEMEKESEVESGKVALRERRQVMRRSNMLAKQVISIQSALSLGFVSHLWVATTAWMVKFVEVKPNLLSGEPEWFLLEDISQWMVKFVEVKPNLLSGEPEWFLLEDISQVGDDVLVHDETVMENNFKRAGLETLVGYRVVTPDRRDIGKDVLEVISDVVVVHEDAASRIQRLTKVREELYSGPVCIFWGNLGGFLGTQSVGNSLDDLEELYAIERRKFDLANWVYRRSYDGQRFRRCTKANDDDDLGLPMVFL